MLGIKIEERVGRLILIKRVSVVLEVARTVTRDIAFVIVGDDGPQLDLVKEAERELPNVTYVSKVNYKDLPSYYNAADIFVYPALYEEDMARVIIESLACGTPVIVTNKGSPPYELDSSVAIITNANAEVIKKHIEFLYANPEKLKTLAEGCRTYAIKRFDFQNAKVITDNYN